MKRIHTLEIDDAQAIGQAAAKRAGAIGSPSNIAVVDAGGHLLSFMRMNDAPLASIAHAIDKAYTAVAYGKPTQALAQDSKPEGPLWGLAHTLQGRTIVFAGGVPIRKGKQVVGALGISGGTADQDADVARAGAAAFKG